MPIQTMTVRELIEQLKQYPADLPVVVQSYEEGFDPVTQLSELAIIERQNRQWYVGIYDEADDQGETALLISSRYSRKETEPDDV